MAEVIFLGTASALPTLTQENSYLVLSGDEHATLVDCAGSPYRQLLQAGLDLRRLDSLILTHFHPDHVYGLPALLIALWLAGRSAPLHLHATAEVLASAQRLIALFQPEEWPGMFTLHPHVIPDKPGEAVLANSDFEIMAAPVRHIIPTIGLRVLNRRSGAALAYSSDTEPCAAVSLLARQASLLIHEASGARMGHSSAEQAGRIAQEAGAERLVLTHYDSAETPPAILQREARMTFAGPIHVAQDLDRFTW